ncbi:MAG TPA: lysozyme inhibitor LprI family protein [Pseudolabrys sp.]|nr:lysozyme inhibitor LprI family protein [Pseudolabrys sp.]
MSRNGVISAAIWLLTATPVLAQDDKPNPRDVAEIQDCIRTKAGRNWAWESCIGIVSEPCVKDEAAMPPSEVMACYERERLVWDSILNESFRRLRGKLDDKQVRKMRDMQRAWIASRDKSCDFFYDYFEGSMANVMIAACQTRETGRRALFLRGFADDAGSR